MTDPHDFDPNAAATGSGIFGLPFRADAHVRILGVPFEATTSFGGGAHEGPALVLEASHQVDLLDAHFGPVWQAGIVLDPLEGEPSRTIAQLDMDARATRDVHRIQELSAERTRLVEDWTSAVLDDGVVPAILGGDHSCPLGAMRAAARTDALSILHFDAHLDLRDAYEGVRESHASILRNVLDDCPLVDRLVQLGIRDYCEEEVEYARSMGERVVVHYASQVAARRFRGESFAEIVSEAVGQLGERVWVSFDIDGLDAPYCPGTGTPVPGGLSFDEACFVLTTVRESGKRIAGFDLCEVAGSAWDGNVGARMLYKLCGLATGGTSWT
ncbi:MAG: agmatinase family protein [Planctomycetes bacterium]|nr:agmatinase family protein [Planctomycetota bacterium]